MKIVFVCTGNTCRSPLAVAAWRALQTRGEVPASWEASSAGLAASAGEAAARHSVGIARGWGVDLSSHRARDADAAVLREADVCVALTAAHARSLEKMARPLDGAPRVLCLGDFLPRSPEDESVRQLIGSTGSTHVTPTEISDPYGGSREAYESCASLIEAAVAQLAQSLQRNQT